MPHLGPVISYNTETTKMKRIYKKSLSLQLCINHHNNGGTPKKAVCKSRATMVLSISFKSTLSTELLLSTCPAFKNSVLPVLVDVDTFTDNEPVEQEFV